MGKRISVEFVVKRRKMVAELIGKGLSQVEVVNRLQQEFIEVDGIQLNNPYYVINPNSREPFHKSTICRDYQALKKRWNEDTSKYAREILNERLDVIVASLSIKPTQMLSDILIKSVIDDGIVYFVERESDGCIKIGKSVNALSRISILETEYGKMKPLGWELGGIKREGELHKRFKSIREDGEFFFPAPLLLDYIYENTFVFNPSHIFHRYALLETMYVDMEHRMYRMQAEIDSIKETLG